MKILIIDNTIDQDCWGASDLRNLAKLAPASQIEVRRAPQEDLPSTPRGYDRVILSGSKTSSLEDAPWISSLLNFIQATVREKIPFLGVCYGHQALIRTLGKKEYLRQSEKPEFGWAEIETLDQTSLFKDAPKRFFSFSAHFEEAAKLPTGMKRLASSKYCSIQACQLEDYPIFGIQFHPEKTLAEARKILAERKKKGTPRELLHSDKSDELYDSKLGELIFRNFFKLN